MAALTSLRITHQAAGTWPLDDVDQRVRMRARLLLRDGRACHYCGRPMRRLGTLDHLWPRSLGRIDARWNLVLACSSCNSRRGSALDWCHCRRCSRARAFGRLLTAARRRRPSVVPAA